MNSVPIGSLPPAALARGSFQHDTDRKNASRAGAGRRRGFHTSCRGAATDTSRAPPPQHPAVDVRRRKRGSVFSPDGTHLIFQSTREGYACDQIFTMKIDGSEVKRVSTGTGRTTCGYFYPGGKDILFASTHKADAACPPKPSFERGYVWPIYDGYDIYRANADGSNLRPLTTTGGYDAEATIAPDGTIAFTSVRDGDMEVY